MYTRKHLFAGMAILPLFFALTLNAATDPLQVTIQQTNACEMKFRITIVNPADRPVSIHINHNRDLLFEDFTLKPTYENIFNLSELEDGEYVILISCGKEKVTRTIRIQTQTKVDRKLTVE